VLSRDIVQNFVGLDHRRDGTRAGEVHVSAKSLRKRSSWLARLWVAAALPSFSPTPVVATRTHTLWFPPPTALASGTSLFTSSSFTLATFLLHARHTSLTNSDFDFAVLAGGMMLGSSWVLRRRRNAASG